jgi:hypothetical protein
VKYGFFSECFRTNSKLLINTKNEDNLRRMADMLIGCLPEEVYSWFEEGIEKQLGYMCRNGLPYKVAEGVRAAYKSRLVEV